MVRGHGVERQLRAVAVVEAAAVLHHPVGEGRGLEPLHDLRVLVRPGHLHQHLAQVVQVLVRQVDAPPALGVRGELPQIELDEAQPREAHELRGRDDDALVEAPWVLRAGHERVDGGELLVEVELGVGGQLPRRALEAEGGPVRGGEVERAERTHRDVLEHPVGGDVHRALRPPVGVRDASCERGVEVEVVAQPGGIHVEEQRLALGLVLVPRGVVLPELLRRQLGGDQRLGHQRVVQVRLHRATPVGWSVCGPFRIIGGGVRRVPSRHRRPGFARRPPRSRPFRSRAVRGRALGPQRGPR